MIKSNNFIPWRAICFGIACSLAPSFSSYAKSAGGVYTNVLQGQYKGTIRGADDAPMAGTSIRNLTKNAVSVSNAAGQFSISGSPGDRLEITHTGYVKKTVILSADLNLNIKLDINDNTLDEVVVVGYNSLKESHISGAVSRVDMANAEKRRVQDVSQMLQGQVSGVNITQSTGQPGDNIDIRIRGVGTLGNNSPLFIVDGVPTTNFSFINPADIESMSVLKDASAASIYGARAAAGVILITTKKGKLGQTKFDVNLYSGILKAVNLPKMMNTQQYLKSVEKAWANSNSSGQNPYTRELARTDLVNTDWLGELFENGKTNSFQIGVSGGSEKVKYLISTGYYKQDGIVIYDNDKYRRLDFRTNLQINLTDRIELKTNILLNSQDKMVVSSKGDSPGIIRHALLRPPVLSVYKDPSDPTYSLYNPFTDLPFFKNDGTDLSSLYEYTQNPIALAYFSNRNENQFKLFGNAELSLSLLKDKSLKFRSMLGLELNFNHKKEFLSNFGDKNRINNPNGLNEDRGEDYTLTWNNVLTYDKVINEDHVINALVGTEFIDNNTNSINASRRRFEYTTDRFQYMDLGGTGDQLWNGGFAQEWALFSTFVSATYSYKNKYSATGNLRADASSRFRSENKWGTFPSIALGWTVSNEDFFPKNKVLTYAKLRASTGALGNQSLPNYAYLTLYNREGIITRYGNSKLKWETTIQNNIGLDLRFFNNKLDLSADYFHKKTKDILLTIGLPTFIGSVDPTFVNAGQVDNKGLEISAKYKGSINNEVNYSIGGNVTSINNKVIALHENVPRIIIEEVSRVEVGQPINAYYGYQMEGIYQNKAEIHKHLFNVSNPNEKPGDIRFKDINDDGVINDLDRTFIGNPIPKWSYGFFVNFNYKAFDFNAFFQGVKGVDRYNDGMRIINFDTRPFNYTTRMLDAWDGEGSSNSLPRLAFENTGVSKFSTLYIEDASYLRLKNIEIGYSFGKYLSKIGVNNARLYLSAQNVFTWTKYTGLDPETTELIDRGTYPQSRTVLLGLNFSF